MKALQKSDTVLNLENFLHSETRYVTEKVECPVQKRRYLRLKRILDILLALMGLTVLLIPMLVIASVICMDSPGNPIFRQVRLGQDQKPFILYKFRSMRIDAEKEGARWAAAEDPRVTRVGRILRKTRIDELPQLMNILKGDMSIVGPRPERPEFYDVFDTYIEGFRQRMLVKPGLTGLAQVNGGYSLMPEEKIVYDLEYIQKLSLRTDTRLIFETVSVVLRGDADRSQLGNIRHCHTADQSKETQQEAG